MPPPVSGSGHVVVTRRDRESEVRQMPHPVSHTEHAVVYVAGGWLEIEHGQPLRATPGSFIVIPAGVPHRSLGGRDLDHWSAGFCSSCLELDESQPLMQPFARVRWGALPIAIVPSSRRSRVLRLFKELHAEAAGTSPAAFELARAQMVLMLGELLRAMPTTDASQPAGSLVAESLDYIHRHALEPLSLADVAAAVHRSPAHVTTAVRKATGHTVGQWIAAAKVAEAARWLSHTDDTLDAITQRVGWRDKTHFIRQFRRVYGQTPAAWRRSVRRLAQP